MVGEIDTAVELGWRHRRFSTSGISNQGHVDYRSGAAVCALVQSRDTEDPPLVASSDLFLDYASNRVVFKMVVFMLSLANKRTGSLPDARSKAGAVPFRLVRHPQLDPSAITYLLLGYIFLRMRFEGGVTTTYQLRPVITEI